MKFNKYFYLSAALAFALCSCSDNDETGGDFTPTIFNVMGKVEKGPMIRGSHVGYANFGRVHDPYWKLLFCYHRQQLG